MSGPGKDHRARRVKRLQPNYFLSLRLQGMELEKNFCSFYKRTAEQFAGLQSFLINPATMHLTMFVMHLPKDHIESAVDLLKDARSLLDDSLQGRAPTIHLAGASTFGNRVVYATPSPSHDLETLADLQRALQDRFRDAGIILVGNKPQWTPHCTLMKMRGGSGNAGASIPPESWSAYKDFTWGNASIAGIDLCSMLHQKEADGYYKRVAHIPFVPD
ncbi:kinase A anchor protein [Fimicolochytrium jonesii]|uniref:kinase A anchor protein n=1 Tax=Fimicolochytrium jonesii TaxID=1396493 RepID=UPI0022FF2750|nr:kinase A anchor protein [Fimicolochytrium jonesii]KAI8815972.1 kinase A anchor protein [Fimicolochytrium jonesii]